MKRAWIVVALVLAVGCDDGGSGMEAGPGTDSGTRTDSGAPIDAGDGVDSGTPQTGGHYFPPGSFFLEDVSGAPAAGYSAGMIAALDSAGGWGNGNRFQIDFSIEVLEADPSTPIMPFVPTGDHYSPDCDNSPMPVPAGGNLEGESGYACDSDGDCHLIVFAPFQERLYEMWRADIRGGTFSGGCLAVWDTSRVYPDTGRGEQCTSADAAGFPIAPLLFTADEVAAGEINHAIRFILPNERVNRHRFVRPATHGTAPAEGVDDRGALPYYGVHFRLRADYPLETLGDAAQVVARALQRYGMYHADGEKIALTAQSDRRSTATWDGVSLGSRRYLAFL
jgi:serine/threonine-protein kinase